MNKERLGYIITLMLINQSSTIASNMVTVFEVFGVDNIPQHSMFSTSIFSCAIACLVHSKCCGYTFGSQGNESDPYCHVYSWLNQAEGM